MKSDIHLPSISSDTGVRRISPVNSQDVFLASIPDVPSNTYQEKESIRRVIETSVRDTNRPRVLLAGSNTTSKLSVMHKNDGWKKEK